MRRRPLDECRREWTIKRLSRPRNDGGLYDSAGSPGGVGPVAPFSSGNRRLLVVRLSLSGSGSTCGRV